MSRVRAEAREFAALGSCRLGSCPGLLAPQGGLATQARYATLLHFRHHKETKQTESGENVRLPRIALLPLGLIGSQSFDTDRRTLKMHPLSSTDLAPSSSSDKEYPTSAIGDKGFHQSDNIPIPSITLPDTSIMLAQVQKNR